MFPYHYGSYATKCNVGKCFAWTWFPYHYGSYATVLSDVKWIRISTFPYHYGSYATEEEIAEAEEKILVSIPLWFLRNLLVNLKDRAVRSTFPYHYGSYATR